MISSDETEKLLRLVTEEGLTLDSLVSELVTVIRNRGLSVTLNQNALVAFVRRFGLAGFGTSQTLTNRDETDVIKLKSNLLGLKEFAQIGKPQLRLTKTVDKLKAWFGSVLTYKIEFENVGAIAASNVEIVDILPDEVEYLATSGDGLVVETRTAPEGNRTMVRFRSESDLDPGAKGSITFAVRVKAPK